LLTDGQLTALGAKAPGDPASVTCGVCYLVPPAEASDVLATLDFREKGGYTRELIDVYPRGATNPVQALLFTLTPAHLSLTLT